MKRPHVSIPGLTCVALLLVIASAYRAPARGDGDPLEMYDFSGRVPLDDFVEQMRTRVHQYGKWTIQQRVQLDPFTGNQWNLTGNSFERINVYYGTRPLWSSKETYQAGVHAEVLGKASSAGHWKLVRDTVTDDGGQADGTALPVVDYTGAGGITLHLNYWNGGTNGGSSGQLIQLVGNTPATAKVRLLWSGQYEELVDLDGDDKPEIIDHDFVHYGASYLPHKGVQGEVIVAWDQAAKQYTPAGRGLYLAAAVHRHQSGEDTQGTPLPAHLTSVDAWQAHLRARAEKLPEILRVSPKHEHERHGQLLRLAYTLHTLLVTGHLDEARKLIDGVRLPHFSPDYEPAEGAELWTKQRWWSEFLAGYRRSSPYWHGLCQRYPALRTLE